MKKIVKSVTALLAAGALSVGMFAFAACDEDDSEHTHSYGKPTWTWSSDNKTATATFTCTGCDDVQEIVAYSTSQTEEATCTADGKTTYTASVLLGGVTYTDCKEVTITSAGHTYDAVTYSTTDSKWYKTCSVCETATTEEVTAENLTGYTLLADSADALTTALAVGSVNIQLTANVEITATNFAGTLYKESETTATTAVIDVAGNKLTVSGSGTLFVTNGKSLTIKDSTNTDGTATKTNLVLNNNSGTGSCFNIQSNSCMTLDGMVVESTGCVLYPKGNAAQVNVNNSTITTTGVYCVGTNSATVDNYNVVINITNSYLECKASDGDSCPVLINVAGVLNISDSEIVGQKQALVVRAGTATVENTVINCVLDYSASDKSNVIGYTQGGSWGDGNNLAFGAVVVGDTKSNAYNADATCRLTGCTISCTTEDSELADYAIAIYATNQDATYTTTVTIDSTTQISNGTLVNVNGGATMSGFDDYTVYNTFNTVWTYVAPTTDDTTTA